MTADLALDAEEDMPERMCIVTRAVLEEDQLIRFVRAPDGSVVADLDRRLPGRGVWVRLERAKVAEAVKKRLFSRGFKQEATTPPDFDGLVGERLRQRALSYLSLAKKAGDAVTGSAKVQELLTQDRVRVLVHSKEAALDGCRKLTRLAAARVDTINFLAGDQLDLAFGRANVIHAAVTPGGLAEKLLLAARRAETYEAAGPKNEQTERA